MIGQERSSDRMDLHFIFNELPFVFMRGGTIHGRASFVILCNASTKRNGQLATTYTLLYAYTDILRWKDLLTYNASINSIHADQLSNAISPPS